MSPTLHADDLRGVYNVLPTPAVRNTSLLTADDTVDYPATTRLVRAVVDGGADGLLTNGTFGEAATLSIDELERFVRRVVEEVNGAVPVFAGATALGTRETIRRGKALLELGATGLFLGRPMWCECDDTTIIGYYSDVAEALPDAPIIVYDNPQVFKGSISTDVYAKLAAIPSIVGSKYVALNDEYESHVQACGDQLTIMPLDMEWLDARKRVGDVARAAWTGSGNCGMAPLIALRNAITAGDDDTADRVSADIKHAMETLFPKARFRDFSRYNIPLEKARFEAAGLVDPGPARPPYDRVPVSYVDGAHEAGRRWAALQQKYESESL